MISRWLKRKSRNNTKKCISVNVAWYDKEEQRSMQLKSLLWHENIVVFAG
jgi:hypothetical protein